MTPKEKAKELYHKFQVYEVNGQKHTQYGPQVKVFALIAVDELVNDSSEKIHRSGRCYLSDREYWNEVKKEIEKL